MNKSSLLFLVAAMGLLAIGADAQEQSPTNTTTITKKLFTYSGPLLPSDWTLVSILNDRAIIGFNNGSARNVPMSELDPKDRTLIQKLQNGTLVNTPLQGAKEKIAQWSSQVTSTVTKLGKSVRDQFDSFLNNNNSKNKEQFTTNTTTTTTIVN